MGARRRTPRQPPRLGCVAVWSVAAFLVLLALAGVIGVTVGLPPYGTRAAESAQSVPAQEVLDGQCPATALGDMQAPRDVRIESNVGHARLVDGASPAVMDPVVRCWPHSARGALAAAMSITGQVSAHPANARALVEAVYVQDEAGRAATEEAEKALAGPGGTFTVVGYSMLVVSDIEVFVNLAVRVPGVEQIGVQPISLRWEEGDWRLLVPQGSERAAWLTPDLASAGLMPIEGDMPHGM